MNADTIQAALADITTESDPRLKHLKLASLVSSVFRERVVELVVVGGSAIEFYTEGAYVSGDLDMCVVAATTALTVRARQEIMATLQAKGGPRSWQVSGLFVDVLSAFEQGDHRSATQRFRLRCAAPARGTRMQERAFPVHPEVVGGIGARRSRRFTAGLCRAAKTAGAALRPDLEAG